LVGYLVDSVTNLSWLDFETKQTQGKEKERREGGESNQEVCD